MQDLHDKYLASLTYSIVERFRKMEDAHALR